MYEKYTYKPEINKISKTLAKESNLEELAFNRKGQERRELLKEEYTMRETSQCTFLP